MNVSALLADVDANSAEILEAIKSGRVVLTTTEGFERIRESKRADTERIFQLTKDLDKANSENVVLLHTLVCVLQSFQGIAAKGSEIFELLDKLGITSAEAQVTGKSIMMKLISNPKLFTTIMDSIKGIVAGFDPSYISRIDAAAMLPILENVQFDFSGYQTLIDAAAQSQFKKLPENV